MGEPSFTSDEQQLLVWLSYKPSALKDTQTGQSVGQLLESIVSDSHCSADDRAQAAIYRSLLSEGAYPNLQAFRLRQAVTGSSTGYQGLALTDGTNSIILNTGSGSIGDFFSDPGSAADWVGNVLVSPVTGVHPQQSEANRLYDDNKSDNGGWNYVVGHSLGGGLTIGVLLANLNDTNTYAYVENSADFLKTALLTPAYLVRAGIADEAKAAAILQGRLQMGASGGDILSSISGTKGSSLHGAFVDAGGHNRDYSYALHVLAVDTTQARELAAGIRRAVADAESVHAEIDRLGGCVVQDVLEILGHAVRPVELAPGVTPFEAATGVLRSFPGRISELVQPILPTLLRGGGILKMQGFLHCDPQAKDELRNIEHYLAAVADQIDGCERGRVSSARRLSS